MCFSSHNGTRKKTRALVFSPAVGDNGDIEDARVVQARELNTLAEQLEAGGSL